ncbi:MAG: sugar ABC transporter substrate-binding protein [Candidatus Humimicrobiaceae bacterium]
MGKKKFFSGLVTILMVIIIIATLSIGCKAATASQSAETTAAAEAASTDKPVKILACVLTMEHEFMQELAAGFKILPEGVEGEVIVEDPHSKIEEEISIIESYMSQNIDAFIGYPIDAKALAPVFKELKAKGIFTVTEGTHVEGEDLGMVTSERDGGLLGGKMFVEWWKENRPNETPQILVLDIPKIEEPQKKPDAFIEYLKENMPEAVIVASQDCEGNAEKGLTVTEAMLQANPEINAIFCVNDASASGALAAVENAKRKDINVIGCGGEPTAIAQLKKPLNPEKGGWAFDVAYEKSAAEFGYTLTEAAVKLIKGENVDKNAIDIGFFALTRETLDDFVSRTALWREKAGLKPIEG